MNALNEQDYLTLNLALDMLERHTNNELAEARRKGGTAVKQMALIALRQRIANVRAKVAAMEAP